MSLLRSLWGVSGDGGGGGFDLSAADKTSSSSLLSSALPQGGPLLTQIGMTYAQAASSSSSGELPVSKKVGSRGSTDRPKLSGAKRPRSPKDSSCGRCFRNTHKMADYRHQIVCLRCACVGTWLLAVRWCQSEAHTVRRFTSF